MALAFGVDIQGVDGLVLAIVLASAFAAAIACYAVVLALKFRTQQAAPLMQAGAFMMVLFTTSYAPLDLLTGWFQEVARYNPVRFILEGVRQMSVYGVDWGHTWKALLALAGLALFFGALAMRGLVERRRRLGRELDRDHVAVGHPVVAALEPQRAPVARAGVAARLDEHVPGDHLGAHEAALDVRVDLARRLPRRRAGRDRVGARLLALARGEERDQLEQLERALDDPRRGRTR